MAFKKFVTRKEYNKKRLSKELLAYIYLSKPHFEGEALNDENALTFLKPQKDDIDEGYLRQMRSILSQYAQDFLVENEFQKRTFYRSHLLAEVLNEKGFTKKAKKILLAQSKKEEKEKKEVSEISDFYKKYQLIRHQHELATQENNKQTKILFSDVVKAFDRYTIAQKLKYACVLLNNQRLLATADYEIDIDYLIKQAESLIKIAEKQDSQEDVLFELYYLLLLVLTERVEEENWNSLMSILKDESKIAHLKIDERQIIITLVSNFFTKKQKQGDTTYIPQHFKLYKIRLNKKELFQQGNLPTYHYKNIVRLACQASEFEAAKKIIEKYKDKVAENFRDDYYALNLATFAFYKNAYNAVLPNLASVRNLERQDHLNVEMLYLKTYYALLRNGHENYDESLRDKKRAFRAYLNRNKKALGKNRQSYKDFLALFKKIFNLQDEINMIGNAEFEAKKAILVQQIENCQELVDKKWLKQQLENL